MLVVRIGQHGVSELWTKGSVCTACGDSSMHNKAAYWQDAQLNKELYVNGNHICLKTMCMYCVYCNQIGLQQNI